MTKDDAWLWTVIPTETLQRTDLTDQAKLLYFHISSLTPTTGLFTGSNSELAAITGYTEQEIQSCLDILEEKEIITQVATTNHERIYFVELEIRG